MPLNRNGLVPLLYFVPLKRGDRVVVLSEDLPEVEPDSGLLEVSVRISRPHEGAFEDANVIVADGSEAIRTIRRVQPVGPGLHSVILLRRSETVWSRPGTLARRLLSFPRSRVFGMVPTWDLLVEPDIRAPSALVLTGFRSAIPIEGRGLKRLLKRMGFLYLLTRDSVKVYSHTRVGAPVSMSELSAEPRAAVGSRVLSIRVSGGESMIVEMDTHLGRLFARFPFSSKALHRGERNYRMLKHLHEKGVSVAPEPIEVEPGGVAPFRLERAIRGTPGRRPASQTRKSAALEAIAELHMRTSTFRGSLTGQLFDRMIEPRLTGIEERLGRSHVQRSREVLRKGMLGKRVLLSACHGDLHPGNCLFEGASVTGFIDWDLGSFEDLSLLDIVHFCSMSGERAPMPQLARSPQLLEPGYRRYTDVTGVDRIDPAVLLRLWQVDRVWKQIRFGNVGGSWLEAHAELDPPSAPSTFRGP